MALHCANARALAQYLAAQPQVEAVHYPGLPSQPAYALAQRQMRDFGGMLSIELRGGRDAALAMAAKLRIFTNAPSLGGCESLVEHRASVEGPAPVTPQNLLRVSVGLEHIDDLIGDFAQALTQTCSGSRVPKAKTTTPPGTIPGGVVSQAGPADIAAVACVTWPWQRRLRW